MTLGFIGCGKMASALVRGIVKAGVCAPSQIFVSDVVEISAKALEEELQVRALKANADVVAAADALVLCVKPQDALLALNELQSKLSGKLVVSIAAGLTLAQLESAAGVNARVVRVMPNTPALVNCGASAYATGSRATEADAHLVERLFAAVGFVGRVKESLLDAVTGLSGSGPAYGYVLVEALADGGVLMGLPRDLSLKLAAQTLLGAAQMILQTGQHPGTLRDAVSSPGGTTIAGIEALEGAGVRAAMISAVRAATERAQALGKASA